MARRHRGSRPHPPEEREDVRPDESTDQRLQKVLAAAGIASRRECEELILAGRVEVDRKTITELGTKVDPLRNEIRVDGVTLPRPKRVYFALNKPPGVVCTNFDPSGRTRVIDMIPTEQRVFPIGRLDRTSEGLILVTNDGALANRLTHPRYGVKKTYQALVAGSPSAEDLDILRRGIRLAEGWARAESVHVRRRSGKSCELIIVLREGRNREIRRMLARIEHKVLRLRRVAVGPILLGDMPLGAFRKLAPEEVEALDENVRESRRELRQKRKAKSRAAEANAAGDQGGESSDAPRGAGGSKERRGPRRDPRQRPKPPPRTPVAHPPELRANDDDDDWDDDELLPGGGDDQTADDDAGDDIAIVSGDFDFEALPDAGAEADDDEFGFDDAGPASPPSGEGRAFRPGSRRGGQGRKFGDRQGGGRPSGGRSGGGRPAGGRPAGGRPQGRKPRGQYNYEGPPSVDGPAEGRPAGGRTQRGRPKGGRPYGGEDQGGGRPREGRPSGGRPSGGRPSGGRPSGGRPGSGRRPGGGGGGGRGGKFGGRRPKGRGGRGGRG